MSESGKLAEANERLEQGEFEEARALFLELDGDMATSEGALSGLGRSAYAMGDWDAAILSFEELLERQPHNATALVYRGLLHEKQEERDLALKRYHDAIEIDPDNPTFRIVYGRALLEENRPTLAEVQLQTAVHLNPNNPLGYYLLGCAFVDNKRMNEAVLRLERAIEVDGGFAEAYPMLGKILMELGREDEACTILRQGLEETGGSWNRDCLRLLVQTAVNSEDFQAALHSLTNQVADNTEACKLALDLSQRAIQLGHMDGAERIATRLVALAPNYGPGHHQLATILEDSGHLENAVQEYSKAHELDPDSWESACRLGTLLLEEGAHKNLEEGVRLLKLATSLAPDDPHPQMGLARGYLSIDQLRRARRMALKVARNEEAPEHLIDEARDMLRRLPVR